MTIPKIIHQTWKSKTIPVRWQGAVDSVRRYHPGWDYRLWTDAEMDAHVETHQPELWPVYRGFEKGIMRADVFRYVAMHDLGGLYADLDYEFLRPFPYGEAELLLSEEFALSFGDSLDQIANYVFASRPGHPFWKDVIDDLIKNPPRVGVYKDVIDATGPGFLSRVFFANCGRYEGVVVTSKPTLSPTRLHGSLERKIFLNSGIIYGIHHGSGSWKERWTATYIRTKIAKLLRL
jgi:mannosyltransferase OCH1-like enzyme